MAYEKSMELYGQLRMVEFRLSNCTSELPEITQLLETARQHVIDAADALRSAMVFKPQEED